jgi:hypothetical protein
MAPPRGFPAHYVKDEEVKKVWQYAKISSGGG